MVVNECTNKTCVLDDVTGSPEIELVVTECDEKCEADCVCVNFIYFLRFIEVLKTCSVKIAIKIHLKTKNHFKLDCLIAYLLHYQINNFILL